MRCSHDVCTQDRPRERKSGWLLLSDALVLLGLIALLALAFA